MALLNSMRKPRFTWMLPLSSTQGTRNMMVRSGSTMRSRSILPLYLGFASMKGITISATSCTAWRNSGSLPLRFFTSAMKASTALFDFAIRRAP